MSSFPKSCHLVFALLIALAIPALAADGIKRTSPLAYDKAHEITVRGTIQRVVSQPAGTEHKSITLIVVNGESTREVALGSFLPKDVEDLMVERKPIQLIGAMQTFRGRQTLMVRRIILDGRTVEVRNEHGFFLRPNQKPMESHPTAAATGSAKGNAQPGDQQ